MIHQNHYSDRDTFVIQWLQTKNCILRLIDSTLTVVVFYHQTFSIQRQRCGIGVCCCPPLDGVFESVETLAVACVILMALTGRRRRNDETIGLSDMSAFFLQVSGVFLSVISNFRVAFSFSVIIFRMVSQYKQISHFQYL